ncbi:nascent polypeptide-associated complex subunit alpha, muscle-specific form-like [Bacillus rossius redtenbacheri]|uniref:nascent polypeptide-associated complex subunit alpha, muscle-specific form-like n=1 Tax=Bacillus rossius redtenbacheri TaxID=93214 RepID=UPI002FDE936A
MSSGSDASQLLSRSNSSPPSPAAEQRSPHSTSSNQGSDSLSSLERPLRARAPSNHSADSILAMFRSFSSSSPRDDVAGSDDSSASSGPAPDSPPRRHTIEVAVLDGRGGHAQHPASILLEVPGAGAAKCLSPIREVPTPALTPVLARRGACSDDEDASPFPSGLESPATRCIPLLVVQEASPTRSPPLGSPPPRSSAADTSLVFGPRPTPRRLLKDLDKPASLDLPCPPPLITVTCNMSEAESDAEVASPVKKLAEHPGPASGMTYLSPFSMCSRADRAASESNLSSSGYSSMASPGPSRCGSNNPLCPSELEDGPAARSRPPPAPLRPPAAAPEVATPGPLQEPCDAAPDCGDSETQSDDPLAESNDEGIGTDHLDEKIDEGELKSAKELQVFIGKEAESSPCRSMLQLPSIVVQEAGGGADKHLSPVSSRSESPLSDKLAGPGRFSPLFYGRHKDQLPFTDSDGLYDCPSSDCPKALQQHRKSTGRRREKRAASRGKAGSPTKVTALLDVPGRQLPRKHSPKRARVRLQTRVSSSSSSESLASARESVASHAVPCPDSQLPAEWGLSAKPRLLEMSAEENSEDAHSGGLHEVLCRGELPKPVRSTGRLRAIGHQISGSLHEVLCRGELPKPVRSTGRLRAIGHQISGSLHEVLCRGDLPKPVRSTGRLRAIGHQIRFLRRLQQGLRQREALASPSDSVDSCADEEDDDEEGSSPVLSPLLPQVTKSQSRLRGPTRHRVPQGWQVLPQEDHYV